MSLILAIILVVIIYNKGSERTKTVMKYMFGYWSVFIDRHSSGFMIADHLFSEGQQTKK
ncbi:MAG: hypothetical protein K5930_11310 [Treponemataceae bacterium]|nr:hypothetical protein [Treponemataceae bacterium]